MIKKITLFFILCFVVAQTAAAQTYFTDDFSDLDISDWTNYDADGDGYIWELQNWSNFIPEFEHTLVSRSWYGSTIGALNPNNYIVSGAIDLTSAPATGLQLEYAYGTIEGAPYHAEQYSVYITTANDLATLQAATAIHNETLATPASRQTNTIDISSFSGQVVYLTFRHHNTFDMNTMMIDDIVIRVPVDTDAIVEGVSLNRYSLQSVDNQLSLDVKNNGINPITSLDVNWNDGTTDHISTISTNIAPGSTVTINHPIMVNYSTVVGKNIDISVDMVNGVVDESPSDNLMSAKFNTLSQSGTKKVLIEEATGTWCGFCPRGSIGMDYMSANYPNNAVLVAVHNADPMVVTAYDNGIGQYISGYPSGVVDRIIEDVDPEQASLETTYNSVINDIVPVDLSVSATQIGSNLTINASATFYSNFVSADTNFRLGAIITEDGVTGTGDGTNANNQDYDQVNYYANNALGPMGGYESLPDPVPATQMVYNHVGRALLGGFNGEMGSIPANIIDGQTISHSFSYTIPATSDVNNMNIVVVLIDQDNGSIVGATESSVNQALSIEEVSGIDSIKIYPNPAKDNINISIAAGNGDYNVTVTDMLGRTVINTSYSSVFGNETMVLPINQLNAGHYVMNINDGKASYSSKFVVSK